MILPLLSKCVYVLSLYAKGGKSALFPPSTLSLFFLS